MFDFKDDVGVDEIKLEDDKQDIPLYVLAKVDTKPCTCHDRSYVYLVKITKAKNPRKKIGRACMSIKRPSVVTTIWLCMIIIANLSR